MKFKEWIISSMALLIVVSLVLWVSTNFMTNQSAVEEQSDTESTETLATEQKGQLFPNISMDNIPEDHKMLEEILYGYNLVNETHVYAEDKVGANLSCTSCHAGAGLDENVASMVGVMADYPKFIPRSGGIVTIEDRINGCMVRSMNGEAFESDSEELKAMVAYFKYISEGVTIGEPRPWAASADMKEVPLPDVSNGEALFNQSCISCHAADGSGNGANIGPALWGDTSFNDGAGLARMSKMAGYIQAYMPVGQELTLTDQEASDLAAFILTQDRPEWKNHAKDWPNGGKPSDIMTKERRDQAKNGTLNWEEVLEDF